MKLKVQQVFDATITLSKIIREERALPQKGHYRLARLHAKLKPEFDTISARRDAMITAYDHHEMVPAMPSKSDPLGQKLVPAEGFSVPLDKMPEFNAAWAEIGSEEIDLDAEPIPLECLDLGGSGSIQANELITLGELVRE